MSLKSLIFHRSLCPQTTSLISPIGCPIIWHYVREYCTYYVHTYGASDYIPSGILSTYDRAYFFLQVGHLCDEKMGHYCTSPWDLISTYHRALSTYHQAFDVLMMGHICSSIGRLRDQKLGHFCAQSFHDHPLGHLCTCLINFQEYTNDDIVLLFILYFHYNTQYFSP